MTTSAKEVQAAREKALVAHRNSLSVETGALLNWVATLEERIETVNALVEPLLAELASRDEMLSRITASVHEILAAQRDESPPRESRTDIEWGASPTDKEDGEILKALRTPGEVPTPYELWKQSGEDTKKYHELLDQHYGPIRHKERDAELREKEKADLAPPASAPSVPSDRTTRETLRDSTGAAIIKAMNDNRGAFSLSAVDAAIRVVLEAACEMVDTIDDNSPPGECYDIWHQAIEKRIRALMPIARVDKEGGYMTHMNGMSESQGAFTGEQAGAECRKCKGKNVTCRTWESSCGSYEDYRYDCKDCGKAQWDFILNLLDEINAPESSIAYLRPEAPKVTT